jgi:hypothetical protein
MNQIIRDSQFRPIGQIRSNGNQTQLFSGNGTKPLAVFNKSNNATYTTGGKLLGKGNLLDTQIKLK